MAPNPYIAGSRLVFSPVVNSLQHDLHYACEAFVDSGMGVGYALDGNDAGHTPVDPADAADIWWSIVKGFYANTVNAPGWVLEQRFGDVFVPVAAGSCAGGAGTGGTIGLCALATLSFSDHNNFGVKFTFPETSFPLPYHHQLVSDTTGFGDFAASVLEINVGIPSVGAWARSRSNGTISLSRVANNTLSKRLRRIRGLL